MEGLIETARCDLDEIAAMLEASGPAWPPSAQYLQKSDVGAITAAWRKLVATLIHEPNRVGIVAALVERVIATFATMRSMKTEGDEGRTREDVRARLVDACEKGAFRKLLKLSDDLNAKSASRARGARRAISEEESKRRKFRTAAKRTAHPRGISAAMALLESDGCAPATMATLDKLVELTPKARRELDEETIREIADLFGDDKEGARVQIGRELVRRCIKTAPKGKTKDLSGLRFEHVQQCIHTPSIPHDKHEKSIDPHQYPSPILSIRVSEVHDSISSPRRRVRIPREQFSNTLQSS
jgi:hypothetical protein